MKHFHLTETFIDGSVSFIIAPYFISVKTVYVAQCENCSYIRRSVAVFDIAYRFDRYIYDLGDLFLCHILFSAGIVQSQTKADKIKHKSSPVFAHFTVEIWEKARKIIPI